MKTQRRRRREGKTDYKARLALLKSEKPRLIIRKSNRYILAQIIESYLAKDKVISAASSRELLHLGWPKERGGSLKSLPAAYLTGLLLAKKTKAKEAILYAGLNRNVHASRIYAALKGVLDGGINVPNTKEILPKIEKIKANERVGILVERLKEKI